MMNDEYHNEAWWWAVMLAALALTAHRAKFDSDKLGDEVGDQIGG